MSSFWALTLTMLCLEQIVEDGLIQNIANLGVIQPCHEVAERALMLPCWTSLLLLAQWVLRYSRELAAEGWRWPWAAQTRHAQMWYQSSRWRAWRALRQSLRRQTNLITAFASVCAAGTR